MGMCIRAVRLGGLPIQCPGMAKGLATPLLKIEAYSSGVEESNSKPVTYSINTNYTCKNARLKYSDSAVILIEQSP